jgi:hypothetical protein
VNGLKRSMSTKDVYSVYFHFLNELMSDAAMVYMIVFVLWFWIFVVLDICGVGLRIMC